MHYSILFLFLLVCSQNLTAQTNLYPFRSNGLYGLVDSQGNEKIAPTYQYIGVFSEDGYAIVQQHNKLGIIDSMGILRIPCQHQFINHTGKGLFATKQTGDWKIINTQEEIILDSMPGKITFLNDEYLSYSEITGVGLVHIQKGKLIPPIYAAVRLAAANYFIATDDKNDQYLYNKAGQKILSEAHDSICISSNFIWGKRDATWIAYDTLGIAKKGALCSSFQQLIDNLYVLQTPKGQLLYQLEEGRTILKGFKQYSTFANDLILVEDKDNKQGISDRNGKMIISPQYDNIQALSSGLFRITNERLIGLLDDQLEVLVPTRYDYISNFDTTIALVRLNNRYGAINKQGELVAPFDMPSTEVTLRKNVIRFKNSADNVLLVTFDAEGRITDRSDFGKVRTLKINAIGTRRNFDTVRTALATGRTDSLQLNDSLIWKRHPKAEKWGVWNLVDSSWHYPPTFDGIEIHRSIGMTTVLIRKIEPITKIQTKEVDIKMYSVFGFFNNSRGLPVTQMEFLDIRMSDFTQKNLPLARVIYVGGKSGLIHRNGRLLKQRYTYIGEFVEGKARCTKVGRLDVDIKQKISHPIATTEEHFGSFDSGYSFEDGATKLIELFDKQGQLYCHDAKWGFLDTLGIEVVGKYYDLVEDYSNNRARVKKDNQWGLIDEQGILVLPTEYDDLIYQPNSNKSLLSLIKNSTLHGAIDTTGKIVIPVQYEQLRSFSCNRIAVKNPAALWGFIDRKANEAIPCQYRLANDFSDGLSVVYAKGRWGAIDTVGNIVIPIEYTQMGDFKEGKAWVNLTKGYKGYIDKTGKLLFKGLYSRVTNFSQNRAAVYVRKKGWGLIDETGKIVLKPQRKIKHIFEFNQHGLAKARVGKKYKLLNKEGKWVSKKPFGIIRDYKEGYAVARKQTWIHDLKGKINLNFVFIDTFGNMVGKKEYSQLQDFSEGRAVFRGEEGKRGYINTAGQIAIAPQYFKAEGFKDNRAVVYEHYNLSGVIDTTGKEVIPIKYKRIVATTGGLAVVRKYSNLYFFVHEDTKRHTPVNFEKANCFDNQVAPVQLGGKWGLINKKGIQVVTPKYQAIRPFESGVARITVTQLLGVAKADGTIILAPKYEYVHYVGNDIFRIEDGDATGYLHKNGNWIVHLRK